jgi:RND family efflux transporter MFP subunit
MKRMTYIGLGVGLVAVAGVTYYLVGRPKDEVKFRTAKLERGTIRKRIQATGSLNAIVQVNVGTQVSGIVTTLNVDYNSVVKTGQVIATIDPTPWEAALRDSQASLERSTASFNDAKQQLERNKRLFAANLVAQQDLDVKQTTFDTSKAALESAKIAVEKAKINLDYCIIKAPVDGVVVSRSVDVGQTVQASFSTPNVFVIAQDLSKMKLETSIDEADIGQVKLGQRALFTVDSYPDKQFLGTVAQVRLEPIIQQNVVTYKVVMEVENELLNPETGLPEPSVRGGDMGGGRRGNREAQGAPGGQQGGRQAQAGQPGQGGRQAQAGQPGQGGRQGMGGDRPGGMGGDPAAREARLKAMGINPADMNDPAKREAAMAKLRAARGAEAGRPSSGGRQAAGGNLRPGATNRPVAPRKASTPGAPRGLNFAEGPVYQGEYALRPGMTANVTIMTDQKDGVLRVPAVALRFNPEAILKAASGDKPAVPAGGQAGQQGGQRPQGQQGGQQGGQRGQQGGGANRGMVARREDRVWIMGADGKPKAIVVKTGLSDGNFTEISGEGLTEGMEILVGIEDPNRGKAPQAGPAPLMGGPQGGGGMRGR